MSPRGFEARSLEAVGEGAPDAATTSAREARADPTGGGARTDAFPRAGCVPAAGPGSRGSRCDPREGGMGCALRVRACGDEGSPEIQPKLPAARRGRRAQVRRHSPHTK